MTEAGSVFAQLTALLEDMHDYAVAGQVHDATDTELWTLLEKLRRRSEQLSRLMADAALTLR